MELNSIIEETIESIVNGAKDNGFIVHNWHLTRIREFMEVELKREDFSYMNYEIDLVSKYAVIRSYAKSKALLNSLEFKIIGNRTNEKTKKIKCTNIKRECEEQ